MTATTNARPRDLVLVDMENLCGGTRFTATQAAAVRAAVTALASLSPIAHVVVGASCAAALLEASLGWSGARLVWRPGHDGADLALAAVAFTEDVVGRFDRVVICSGDGMFTLVARYLQRHGMPVTVVSRRDALSGQLRRAVADVRTLGDTPLSGAA